MQAPDCSPGHGAEMDAGRWLTSDLMHMFDSAGLVAKPKSGMCEENTDGRMKCHAMVFCPGDLLTSIFLCAAQTQKTAGTRASALIAPSGVSKHGRDARDNQSLSENV